MATHRRLRAKTGPDFFPTPVWATKALLEKEEFINVILEPCCGNGAVSRVLKHFGHKVHEYDLYDRGVGYQKDAMTETRKVSNIITNPPYNIVNELFMKWSGLYKRKMCLLLRLSFLEGSKRYYLFQKYGKPSRVWVFSERVSMYLNGDQGESGSGTICYAWFVWDRSDTSGLMITDFIEPGHKPKPKRRVS